MKSNRKFLARDDAVSPVIGVILMVAITVVLSATVYVWVSGFSAQTTQPARSISLAKNAPLTGGVQAFTITSASGNLHYSDLQVTVDGATQDLASVTCSSVTLSSANTFAACGNGAAKTTSSVVSAGDLLYVQGAAGKTLRVVDLQANSVLATYTLG